MISLKTLHFLVISVILCNMITHLKQYCLHISLAELLSNEIFYDVYTVDREIFAGINFRLFNVRLV